jgi:hypothetical protein
MKSKKDLFVALDTFFKTDKYTKNGLKAVGNETYGRKSMIYVGAGTFDARRSLEKFLIAEGFKVHTDYFPGSDQVEVQVSYFRGYGWDK